MGTCPPIFIENDFLAVLYCKTTAQIIGKDQNITFAFIIRQCDSTEKSFGQKICFKKRHSKCPTPINTNVSFT